MVKKQFNVYKGLQRPLVFKMFKGRFIYWGLGSLVGGIVAGIAVGAILSSLAGLVAMLAVSFPLLLFTIQKQKNGLYDKRSDKAVFIIAPHHHIKKNHRNQV